MYTKLANSNSNQPYEARSSNLFPGDISPVENTPGDKSRGHTFVTATCRMNSNRLESMRHVLGTKFPPPPDKISHGVYDGICPCNMSPRFVASCVLTLKVRLHDATKLMRHATKSRCVNGLKAETHRTRNRNATRFSKVFKSE